MADGVGDNCHNGRNNRINCDDEDQNEDNEDASSPPDIGLGHPSQIGHQNLRECASGAGCGETSRREENPVFSFKHFLSGSGNRPAKVSNNISAVLSQKTRIKKAKLQDLEEKKSHHMHSPPPPRIHEVTGLPDFVQDHLVIEQCYLNANAQQPMAVDLDHLPDFTGHDGYDGGYCRSAGGQDTSLPDFLSDGPIRSERRDSDSPPPSPQNPTDLRHSPRFQMENERLRHENERLRRELEAMRREEPWALRELESLRRQLSDQITRCETLEAELSIARNREPPDDLTLEKLRMSEDNSRRARKKLLFEQSKNDKLREEVEALRNELEAMRCREGTASTSALQTDSERLASQLRNAANTAELSLRHLLIGVDNLRQLAASIESQQAHGSGSRRRGAGVHQGTSRPLVDSSDESLDEDPDYPQGPAL